ncbi:glycerophosphodiester phosphodiesterase [Variovorax sp. ZT4R33]|uniref:glycerophosphodiester phosphodiesterase n=1 Tax=Variovorax sp. ZT4R33 TaxID=3443743 RepID=UPI003F466C23
MSNTRAVFVAALTALALSAAHAFDIQAHRGGRGLWPENTLQAFDQAITLGVSTLELDVALTADGVVVVSHDMALNPDHTRDATGAWLPATGPLIRSLTFAQLQAYDVGRLRPGSQYAEQFATQTSKDGERIPTLAGVFALVKERRAHAVRFNIETKLDPARPDDSASPEAMVRALLAEIDKAGMAERVTIQSFDWRSLVLVGKITPQMPRAYLTTARTLKDSRWTAGLNAADFGSTPQLVKAVAGTAPGPVVWSPAGNTVTAAAVKEAHALGLQVIPWTINTRTDMANLIDLGVDGLISDFPDLLRTEVRLRGLPMPLPAGPVN